MEAGKSRRPAQQGREPTLCPMAPWPQACQLLRAVGSPTRRSWDQAKGIHLAVACKWPRAGQPSVGVSKQHWLFSEEKFTAVTGIPVQGVWAVE